MVAEYATSTLVVIDSAVLVLHATGRVTGVVVDSGFSQTSAAVVVDGAVVGESVVTIPVGGKHVTEVWWVGNRLGAMSHYQNTLTGNQLSTTLFILLRR